MKTMNMKKISYAALGILLAGCVATVGTITGKYQDTPYEIKTDKSFEEVWSNVIDFFAQKGISIKIIDKSSGLIISEKTSFLDHYSTEVNGAIRDFDAWIVLNSINHGSFETLPDHVYGEWNVRLKPMDGGGTLINVNLTNIDAGRHVSRTQYTPEQNIVFKGKSTGKFESFIAKTIK
jgi:hypothetical protein